MADEDILLTEDQLLDDLDDTNNGDSESLDKVDHKFNHFPSYLSSSHRIFGTLLTEIRHRICLQSILQRIKNQNDFHQTSIEEWHIY